MDLDIYEQKQKPLARIKKWISAHKKISITILSLLILAIIGLSIFALAKLTYIKDTPKETATQAEPTPVKPVVYYASLTGKTVSTKDEQNAAVTAIMIENSPDARPQSGLKDSGIVFEAIAEGGITRFLVLYQSEKPALVGPVRSVRMYYVDWLTPFNASIAHVGGSSEALKVVRDGTYRDLDQFFNADHYWRATDRYAPHNVYTSFEKLDALNSAKGYTTSTFASFPRKNDAPAGSPTATAINVNISGALYNSQYTYDPESNSYLRSQAGAAHLDRESGQIAPKVVVALMVNESLVFEDGYREQIDTVGNGEAFVFQDGTITKCTWQKTSRSAQLEFYTNSGDPVPFNRGQTWISAVPNSSGSVSWQ